jgi:undecaprenyl-phosphate galactose phosphotransferase
LIAADGAPSEVAGTVTQIVRRKRNLTFGIVPSSAGILAGKFAVDCFLGNGLIVLREATCLSRRQRVWAKRFVDMSLASVLLFLFLPIMLVIAWCVRRDGGPVFYASPRLGRAGEPFLALKFRTMAPDADRLLSDLLQRNAQVRREWEARFKLRHDPRITAVGRLLRKLSLDELPQLINVIKGDMSLVGPRPILPAERVAYGEAFEIYCECVPGLTGLWQVSGRNDLDYQRRIELNNWYINNASIWLDIIILFRTVPAVMRRIGSA